MKEQPQKGYPVTSIHGCFKPKCTPGNIIEQLREELTGFDVYGDEGVKQVRGTHE